MPDPDQELEPYGETSEGHKSVETPGGLPQEDVDDRPDVSSVTPEDYPLDQRAKG
ncbi:MAG: hypothetical protein V4530_01845 [Pseudomonadota bacterium]